MNTHNWPQLRVHRHPNADYPDIATYWIMGPTGEPGNADVVWGETDNDPETAQLFAAAPDLLDALEAMMHGPLDGQKMRRARNAINKAKGLTEEMK